MDVTKLDTSERNWDCVCPKEPRGGYIDSPHSGGVQRHSLTLNPQRAMEDSDTIDCGNRGNLEKNIRRGFSFLILGFNMLHNDNSKHLLNTPVTS